MYLMPKIMKRILFVLFTLFCFLSGESFAFAAVSLDTSGLTEAQKAELVLKAEELKKQAVEDAKDKIAKVDVDEANKWVDLGRNIATTITTTAGELGIAADKFLDSTSGKITLLLIFWHVAGRDFVGLVVGIPLLIVLICVWVWSFRRMCIIKSVTEKEPEKGFKKNIVYEYYSSGDKSVNNTRVWMFCLLIAIIWICCGFIIF